MDWTSITFSITGLLFLQALYGQNLLNLAPIARDKLIRNLGDGMIVLDTQNRIIDINQTAAVMIDSSAENLLGKELGEVAPLIRPFLELPPEQEIKNELEVGTTKKRYFDFLISPLREGVKKIIGRLIIFRDITERKENEMRLLQLTKELQETQAQVIAHERILAALDERRRLGRDMHDSVNQSIHSMMLFSETLSALLEKNQVEKAIYIAQRIQESGRQALKEIRLLVFETQSMLAIENMDLVNALKERLKMVEHRVGIKSEVICGEGALEYCPAEWGENLYWMTMEALNNSLKHARARHVRVIITRKGKQFNLAISDDGVGFDPNQIQAGGFGMRTMRERAEILGGQLSVESSPGRGTRVYFTAETEA